MADIISTLFGVSPQQAKDQRLNRDLDLGGLFAAATVNPYAAPSVQNAYMKQQQAQFGLGGMAARGAAGLFGFQDPEVKKASDIENILTQTQEELGPEGLSNPELLFPAIVDKLSQAGYGREAAQAAMQGQQVIQEYRLAGAKVATEGATAQEKATASQLNVAKTVKELRPELTEIEKLIEARSRATADNKPLIDRAIDDKLKGSLPSIEQKIVDLSGKRAAGTITAQEEKELDYLDNFKTKVAKAGASSVSVGGAQVDLGQFGKTAGQETAKKVVVDLPTSYKAEAYVDQALSMLDEGISSGALADVKINIAKYSAALGVPIGNIDRASNTEVYKAFIGNVVIPMMAQLGGSDSNEELKKMEAIVAGDVTLEEASMRRILKSAITAIKSDRDFTINQSKAATEGTALPLEPSASPQKPTKRWNPTTQKFEVIQ